ncbi:dihydrofolate reductase family protein [Peribacillus sp. SCS-26]|uniref:dihydrofolate reductase family protein n=1 Tax=Paraperibacillus marinus TaxID=3115295 RepID=UPI003906C345
MSNQRKVVLLIAISIDGYIAREDDSLDWLYKTDFGDDYGFADFIEPVDAILMGRKTYDQIPAKEDEMIYGGRKCYVFSRSVTGASRNIEYVNEDIVKFTTSLIETEGGTIWVVGGGEMLRPLLQAQLVDEIILQMAPAAIGRGIPLFQGEGVEMELSLKGVRRFNQLAELHYVVKK